MRAPKRRHTPRRSTEASSTIARGSRDCEFEHHGASAPNFASQLAKTRLRSYATSQAPWTSKGAATREPQGTCSQGPTARRRQSRESALAAPAISECSPSRDVTSFPLSRSYGHARLASGWWPTSTGRGSRPRKVPNKVSASSTWLPPHPSFRNASNDRVLQLSLRRMHARR